jgi:hypothetical protein
MHTTIQATRSGMNYFTAGNGPPPSQAYWHITSPTQRFSIAGRTSMLHRCHHYARSCSVYSKEGWNWNLHYQYLGPADAKYIHQSNHVQHSLSPDGWGGSHVFDGSYYELTTATSYKLPIQ